MLPAISVKLYLNLSLCYSTSQKIIPGKNINKCKKRKEVPPVHHPQ